MNRKKGKPEGTYKIGGDLVLRVLSGNQKEIRKDVKETL